MKEHMANEWLLPSEGGPDDGLLMWTEGRKSLHDLPFEIVEKSNQVHGHSGAELILSVIDHLKGCAIGDIAFELHDDDSYTVRSLSSDPLTSSLTTLFAEIVSSESSYLSELRGSSRLLKKLRSRNQLPQAT